MGSPKWLKCGLIVLSVVIAIGGQVLAQAPSAVALRPDPDGVATPVSVGLYLIDIAEIDDVAQTFTGDLLVTLTWHDPRLALPPDAGDRHERVVPVSEIWHPGLTLINRRDVQILAPDFAYIDPEGRVTVEGRRYAEFASPFALHDFHTLRPGRGRALLRSGNDRSAGRAVLDRGLGGRSERGKRSTTSSSGAVRSAPASFIA